MCQMLNCLQNMTPFSPFPLPLPQYPPPPPTHTPPFTLLLSSTTGKIFCSHILLLEIPVTNTFPLFSLYYLYSVGRNLKVTKLYFFLYRRTRGKFAGQAACNKLRTLVCLITKQNNTRTKVLQNEL